MRSFTVAFLSGAFIGLVVYVLCWIIGGLPHLEIIRVYAWAFGLLAGVLVFSKRWDWRTFL